MKHPISLLDAGDMQALSILDAIPALPPEFGVFES